MPMSLNGCPPAGKPLIISHVQYFRPIRLTECPDVWGPDRRGPTVFDFLGAGPPGRISCPVQYKGIKKCRLLLHFSVSLNS